MVGIRWHVDGQHGQGSERGACEDLVRLGGLFNKDLRAVTPRLGRKRDFTSAKAQTVLGWRPRSSEETIIDCAKSLIAAGLV